MRTLGVTAPAAPPRGDGIGNGFSSSYLGGDGTGFGFNAVPDGNGMGYSFRHPHGILIYDCPFKAMTQL